jgi:hypothetical protein
MSVIRKLVVAMLLVSVAPAFGLQHVRPVSHKRHKKTRKPTWFEYRVFVPSHENLLSQNAAIDAQGLPRIKDDKVLKSLVSEETLVPITVNQYVSVSSRLEKKRRFCRPEVDQFLQELGRDYFTEFGSPIQVNSAVRTEKTQSWLRRWNHNAAPVHGETASAHLAGVAVDLQRRGLTREQVRFIQQKLLYLSKLKMVIVEEELKQPCFHIVVTGEYPVPPKLENVLPSTVDWSVLNGIIGVPAQN